MASLGIEFISVFGMPLTQFVELAAGLDCRNVSIGLNQMDYDPHGYARYSLAEDQVLQRELKASLDANGVSVSLGENLPIMAEGDSREMWKASLDVLSRLGATRINSVSFEPNIERNIDQYGILAELTASYGIDTLIEFVPIFGIPDVPTALHVIEKVGHPRLGMIVDTMHVARSGATVDDLRALPPELVGYIQLCDVPRGRVGYDFMDAGYMDEAMHQRYAPGDGELPLADYLAALPADRVIGLEIPLRSDAEAGKGPRERLDYCLRKARDLLADL